MNRHEYRGAMTCALIAIKERLRCKTRLAEALAPAARIELVRSMLAAVLSAAGGARSVRQIIVVSPERDSVPAHVPVLADTGESPQRRTDAGASGAARIRLPRGGDTAGGSAQHHRG